MSTTTTKTLHFTVCFEGMTDRVREFWAEGKYDYTLDLLVKGFNLTREQACDVINGSKKMVDDPEGEPGVNGTLAPDSWKPEDDHFSDYPMAEPTGLAAKLNAERRKSAKLAKQLDEERERQWNSDEARAERANATFAAMGVPTVDTFVNRQTELDKRPTPKSDRTYASDNAWVLPNGKLYACKNAMEHIWLADKLKGYTEKQAEQVGWIKLSFSALFGDQYIVSFEPPTQAQINTLFDWSQSARAVNKTRREKAYKEWLEAQDEIT